MTAPVLTMQRRGAVAVLEINRPAAKNSLDPRVLAALRAELENVRHDDAVRVLIVTGHGDVFCAGADISCFDRFREEPLIGPRAAFGGSIWADLGSFPKPVIAAVEGLALGGGCELALACDIVIAGAGAQFALPEVRLGVIPGGVGTQRLITAVGKPKAMALLLTGDPMSAAQAHVAGLVAEVVPDGEAVSRAESMAARIARNSPLAVALAKDAALAALETSLSRGLEHEKRNFHVALHSADCREGERAFLDKRTPEFTGR